MVYYHDGYSQLKFGIKKLIFFKKKNLPQIKVGEIGVEVKEISTDLNEDEEEKSKKERMRERK